MEKIGQEIFEEYSLPEKVKIALDEVDQIFGNSDGIVKELGEAKLQIKKLQKELSRCGNVKNHRLSNINTSLSEKRNNIRRKIAELRDRIEELNLIHEGKNS